MFNLKRKSEQQLIAEIHNEFDTAEDRLLQEADNMLLEINIPTQEQFELKAKRLSSLGFEKAEVVVRAKGLQVEREEKKTKLVLTKAQAELIRYYKQNYPFQKFLTEDELNRICSKYNLIFAPVKNYIKDVPEKNLKEIENSPILKVSDKVSKENYYRAHKNNISKECPSHVKQALLKGVLLGDEYRDKYYYLEDALKRQFNVDVRKCVERQSDYHDIIEIDKSKLFIAAPSSHFDLEGLTKKGQHAFLNMKITEVKDPIVFRYVRGGVQVLSKWGLEASDETLVNEINN